MSAAALIDRSGPRERGFGNLPLSMRFAMEMAVNEENERFAFEGELALLELDWREAEEIAAIADNLVVPLAVQIQYETIANQKTDTKITCPGGSSIRIGG